MRKILTMIAILVLLVMITLPFMVGDNIPVTSSTGALTEFELGQAPIVLGAETNVSTIQQIDGLSTTNTVEATGTSQVIMLSAYFTQSLLVLAIITLTMIMAASFIIKRRHGTVLKYPLFAPSA